MSLKGVNWAEFLGREPVGGESALAESAVESRAVLITGAGGSIGSDLAAAVLAGGPRSLIMLDISESALYESHRRIVAMPDAASSDIVPRVGSVGDSRLLERLMRQHQPELIFHAAAYKHVPLMERNPFSAIENNSMGTHRLVVAALEAGVGRLVFVSTDKAVNPVSVMGVSKRIAELAVLSHSASEEQGGGTRMNVVRLCNVLGSSGSVAEVFQEQAGSGLPFTVTDAEAKRYFLAPEEARRAVLQAAASHRWSRVLVPECGEEFRIVELARYLANRNGVAGELAIEFSGLRRGDKLREELWSADERVEAVLAEGTRVIESPTPDPSEISRLMEELEDAVEESDDAALMRTIQSFVPGYVTSAVTNSGGAPVMAE